ncbi:MotA/TolQ/ExbB proton channel family protein [Burkholderia sp. WAC0059]|uniref:MotA/TolQ/ExbB proton channel family protein n=1 Tax=Burkholderia sp. WAC0059 TaxID=2066022 RepID=UPI000C7E90E3|nr:MotA/TolQ/ExbB proton channel family protein [Burkholderia sp. WAC0059]PLZ02913.1 MotA/TolQ/ExbB proton channel family protein [Burkholderia sp. WAC0059]
MQDWPDFIERFIGTARIAGWIVYPLSLIALAALVIILERAYVFWRFAPVPGVQAGLDGTLNATLAALPERHALRRLMTPLAREADKPVWWIEERAGTLALEVQRDMSRGLWVLETVVTAAPLVGLLGTIVGMMRAFRLLGDNGLVNPAGVTGGVAQALVATAIGLVVALVALFAFNYFSRRIDRLVEEMEAFAGTWLAGVRLARETAAASP